jgi:hypothetical protein
MNKRDDIRITWRDVARARADLTFAADLISARKGGTA